ncbi:MAG: head-tail connector protein [Betaproteobacteria bacterium]|nr:head-tail connector protein [Betaproteobacteria bacterium]
MPYRLLQAPAVEPLSLADAKLHLRVDITDDDELITALISAARQYAENYTRRAIIQQKWKLVIDSFPGPTLIGVPWGKRFTLPGHAIFLERSQVQQVSAINYTAMDGTAQTMPSADYTVDYTSEPCRITPVFGQIWPIPLPQIGAVEVDFWSGYAAPVTFSLIGNTMTVQGAWWPYNVGDCVQLSNVGGAPPAALSPNTNYFIQSVVSPGVYTLSATAGGAVIPLADAGSGTSLVGVVPEGLKAWMKIRLGSLYQHREADVVVERVKVQPLEWVDRLLDPFTVVF